MKIILNEEISRIKSIMEQSIEPEKPITEDTKSNRQYGIYIPLKVGDIIYTGRFRNKKTTVKSIAKDEYGMPTVNGKRVMNFRKLPEDKK